MSQDLVITRTINAPRALVWKAWTDPDAAVKWWGPKDFTSTIRTMDVRPGGKYHIGMIALDGKIYWTTGIYKEVVPMEKLVMTDSFADENGNVISGAEYGMPEMQLEMLVILTLEDAGEGKTKLTIVHQGLPGDVHSEQTGQGWNEMLDKLETTVG